MNAIHRTLDGNWAECSDVTCKLKFHLPDITVTEAAQIPLRILLPLLEPFDPPHIDIPSGMKVWHVGYKTNAAYRFHRSYDLPAVMKPDGELQWWRNGVRFRDQGRPTSLQNDGTITHWGSIRGKVQAWE